MHHPGLFAVLTASLVVVLVAAFPVRRPVQDRLYRGTGLTQWRATARTLSWRRTTPVIMKVSPRYSAEKPS